MTFKEAFEAMKHGATVTGVGTMKNRRLRFIADQKIPIKDREKSLISVKRRGWNILSCIHRETIG